ncbi:MAG: hypothetical protein NT027_09355 [Proteobacteria bacterium]|nr:hypothetical protein [Pseudomonadota bacterium]
MKLVCSFASRMILLCLALNLIASCKSEFNASIKYGAKNCNARTKKDCLESGEVLTSSITSSAPRFSNSWRFFGRGYCFREWDD